MMTMIKIQLQTITKKRRAYPFIEEGILIVFGLFIFLIILGSINQILNWFVTFSEKTFNDLKSNIPFVGTFLGLPNGSFQLSFNNFMGISATIFSIWSFLRFT